MRTREPLNKSAPPQSVKREARDLFWKARYRDVIVQRFPGLPFRAFILFMGVWGTMAPVAAELADPTRPLGYMTPDQTVESGLTLTSVLITRNSRSAVINGKRVVEGQRIGDTEVVSIHPGGVILGRGNLSRELKVHQDDVKHFTD